MHVGLVLEVGWEVARLGFGDSGKDRVLVGIIGRMRYLRDSPGNTEPVGKGYIHFRQCWRVESLAIKVNQSKVRGYGRN